MQIRPAAEVPLTPRRSMRRWVIPAVLMVLLALIVAGYTGWWLAAAARLRDGALSWVEQRQAQGYLLDHGQPTRAGFPFAVGVNFPDARAALPRADWSWRSQDVRVSVPVIGRRVLTISLQGEQTLILSTAPSSGEHRSLTGGAESLALSFDPGDVGTLGHLTARQLALSDATGDGFGVGGLDVVVSRLLAEESDSVGGVMLNATDVHLPAAATTPLGRDVRRLDVNARLIGDAGWPLDPAALAAWRDEGGTVEIDRLVCDYGPVSIEADGTLALDRGGQPIGALATHIRGWQAGLDSLVAAEAVPPYTVAAAKILLRGLTRGNDESGGVLEAPLSLQDQTLSLGPVPLFHVPRVAWLDPESR